MGSEQKPFVPKTPIDFQKLKLERLMANPEKPVIIPEMPRERKGFTVPEFVRNVMGSSAGAGSGEFHVYRHLRRKEYTRQKVIDEKAETEKLDEEYQQKILENQRIMEERTAKKRAKRLKRKARLKMLKSLKKDQVKMDTSRETVKKSSSEEESSENEESDEERDKANEHLQSPSGSNQVPEDENSLSSQGKES
ncbi:PRKR-interacting protein 1 homolog [Trichonephila clavata]|uniref:PRKR-interacting protein 1 homolog n=1 Tax=Trichonephila clavata TaxID=2740835 RepID=A0A8X6J072_TRICU|nr:PRKR-interacting protein 1 homolog [Trichonephila clavata]